jgi:Clp amino terminal domain, pathogenicity island component
MTTPPISLDNLIAYVKTVHPDGGPLENLSDAIAVSAQLDEQSDALIGHFVDQARRSGASWSQIGAGMGVSKQAAQQRFVSHLESAEFSQFTQRARNVLAAAGHIARHTGADLTDTAHLTTGLLSEPDGLAAKVIHGAGLSDEQILDAFGLEAVHAGDGDADPVALGQLRFTNAGRGVLRETVKAALRMGHNYIGTEHLLLGILLADGAAAQTLTGLGLTPERAEQAIAAELAAFKARRHAG